MQKVTKRSRLHKNRLKFMTLRYSEKAVSRLHIVSQPFPYSAATLNASFSLLNAPLHKFLDAIFMRPPKKNIFLGGFSLKNVLKKWELYASRSSSPAGSKLPQLRRLGLQ
jgi:hypothetical protein